LGSVILKTAFNAEDAEKSRGKTKNKAKLVLTLLVKGDDLVTSCFYSANLCALCGKLLFIGLFLRYQINIVLKPLTPPHSPYIRGELYNLPLM
jgi:hypothetical protein